MGFLEGLLSFVFDGVAGTFVAGASFCTGYVAFICILCLIEDRSNDSGQPVLDLFVYTPYTACIGCIAASCGLLPPLSWTTAGGWAAVGDACRHNKRKPILTATLRAMGPQHVVRERAQKRYLPPQTLRNLCWSPRFRMR